MNALPIPEDPPVTMTAVYEANAVSREGMRRMAADKFGQDNPQQKVVMNRNNESNELIVSGIHLDLTPSLKTFVQEKVERLFRHEVRIVRMRVELESDPKQEVGKRFTAKGHIKLQGIDLNASVATNECHKSVALLVDKMDRMLRRNSRLGKVKRNNPQPVEFDIELPKVAAV